MLFWADNSKCKCRRFSRHFNLQLNEMLKFARKGKISKQKTMFVRAQTSLLSAFCIFTRDISANVSLSLVSCPTVCIFSKEQFTCTRSNPHKQRRSAWYTFLIFAGFKTVPCLLSTWAHNQSELNSCFCLLDELVHLVVSCAWETYWTNSWKKNCQIRESWFVRNCVHRTPSWFQKQTNQAMHENNKHQIALYE